MRTEGDGRRAGRGSRLGGGLRAGRGRANLGDIVGTLSSELEDEAPIEGAVRRVDNVGEREKQDPVDHVREVEPALDDGAIHDDVSPRARAGGIEVEEAGRIVLEEDSSMQYVVALAEAPLNKAGAATRRARARRRSHRGIRP